MTIKAEKLRAFIDSVKELIQFLETTSHKSIRYQPTLLVHYRIIKTNLAELEGDE